ncbi:hypothetical protein HELRODRAFT_194841 [Helobdella robusta]|uniref:Rab-GAP TBC domain-containing protein n=1 Tax=Helobdella robusta TaxID=6412 RepID=T1FWH1_HELRO|nr:hypothetical protein HELRODRAFT_194841 [Helobdella robusta]ESO11332.1 hypothetical protein HELRODRAFT_194841 [Helobdella robusta]
MDDTDIISKWSEELEAFLLEKDLMITRENLLNVTRCKPLPARLRAAVWKYCLDVQDINDEPFNSFDAVYDLPQQEAIRADCKSIAEKNNDGDGDGGIGDDDDCLSLQSELESIITHYCKSRRITYSSDLLWKVILKVLLKVQGLRRAQLYNVFSVILDKFIFTPSPTNQNAYHLFRLLLLYHDPYLCQFLDTKKIAPENYANEWFCSLFSKDCLLEVSLNVWDVYFQLNDPFFIFFLVLVIVINARDQIVCMVGEDRTEIINRLGSFASALEAEDVEDLCSLGQYYASKTPASFKIVYQHLVRSSSFSSLPSLPSCSISPSNQPCNKLVSSLCLELPASEILKGLQGRPTITTVHSSIEQMLQNPKEFLSKVNSLLFPHNADKSSEDEVTDVHSNHNISLPDGKHICFVGYGDKYKEDDDDGDDDYEEKDDDDDGGDGYMNMVVAHFLHKHVQYVSVCRGGYQGLHNWLVSSNMMEHIVGHSYNNCSACTRNNKNKKKTNNNNNNKEHASSSSGNLIASMHMPNIPVTEAMEKMTKLSSALKLTSATLKDKVMTYIKNEQQSSPSSSSSSSAALHRHVSSADNAGRRYRNIASVFTIGDEDDEDHNHVTSSEEEVKEVVLVDGWIKKFTQPQFVYKCFEVATHNSKSIPSLLCLTGDDIIILRLIPDEPHKAWIQSRRSLTSVLKITSKKRQPELITIKYGTGGMASTKNQNSVIMTDNSVSDGATDKRSVNEMVGFNDCGAVESNYSTTSPLPHGKTDVPNVENMKSSARANENVVQLDGGAKTNRSELDDRTSRQYDDVGLTVTAIDRFYIPKAGEATKDIKMHILKLMKIID